MTSSGPRMGRFRARVSATTASLGVDCGTAGQVKWNVGGPGTIGWDDVLGVDNNDGPHIDEGQFTGFGNEKALPRE
jgi:hypothetical protein